MNVLITVDVEAHRLIDEITGPSSDSLGDILGLLQKFGYRVTFFVDVCEVPTWGEDFMRRVCKRIVDAGQDIQLHAHPHHMTGDQRRWLLSEYTREEQGRILDYAIAQYVRFVGVHPLAFRAGGFGANRDTLELLHERGVKIDCSLMQGWRGCELQAPLPGAPFSLHGVRELPLTPATMLGLPGRPLRTGPIDFNWMPLFVMKRILRRLKSEDAPVATILMHSSSLCMRLGSTRFPYRRSRFRKLVKMLSFLKEENLAVTSIDSCETRGLWDCEHDRPVAYFERNFLRQYATLLFQSFVGMSFKPRFAYFLGFHFFMLICGLTAVLFLAR
jgi:peptidoglycan/xylan/chitin deacetylase (PgdA/CDA1 family)